MSTEHNADKPGGRRNASQYRFMERWQRVYGRFYANRRPSIANRAFSLLSQIAALEGRPAWDRLR